MTAGPLIERELRCLARQHNVYLLRVIVAVIAMVEVTTAFPNYNAQANSSAYLFQTLHFTVFGVIWLTVPFLTADCISRERREGTLGLLFLTPLRAWEVVAAKCLAHGLRGATIYLVALPALAIPMIFGGISGPRVLTSALILGLSLALALSAGLLASILCIQRHYTMVLATLFAAAFFLLTSTMVGWCAKILMGMPVSDLGEQIWLLATNALVVHSQTVLMENAWGIFLTVMEACVPLVLVPTLIVWVTVRRVHILGKDLPRPNWRLWLTQTLCRPIVARGLLRWRSRRVLASNPVAWLVGRRWTSRALMWLWMGGVGIMLCVFLASDSISQQGHAWIFQCLFLLLAVCLAVDASGCFFRERSGGLLELILVSPVQEWHIITGMTRGLLWRYLPAAGFLLLAWWATEPTRKWYEQAQPAELWLGYFVLVLPLLPMVGLYFSLRCRHFPKAVAGTLLLGLFVPWLATQVFWSSMILRHPHLKHTFDQGRIDPAPLTYLLSLNSWPPLVIQAAIAAFLCWALAWRLRDRNFIAF
jgi:ABC-type transport system involved in multi-copper enzyme maturation permease subunit